METVTHKIEACSLRDQDYQNRITLIREQILPHVIETKEMPSGWQFDFPDQPELKKKLTHLIGLEKQCCPALGWTMTEIAAEQKLRLTITGIRSPHDFQASLFG